MDEHLRAFAQGCTRFPVAAAMQQAALQTLEQWLTAAPFAPYRPQLLWLIEQQRWSLLLDSFYRILPFGTGGRRGAVGVGSNRFNAWTLASSVQGHAAYLKMASATQDLSVVIAYDVRAFYDLRGLYNPNLANPLLGMTSRDFARVAAGVYVANDIRVYMPAEQATTYLSTPELSFTIRALQASAGLNISASHNHPDDNGGKFYNRHGGQDVPPDDEVMANQVEGITEITGMDFEAAKTTGLITWIDPGIHQDYLALNRRQSLQPSARQATLVFTPLHGTATSTVGEVLQQAGFTLHLVPSQATPDGAFPGVPFRAPNPEVPESMQQGMALAQEVGADAVLACDPDADRLGVCSRTADGTYRFLTGNDIAVLVTHYKLEQLQRNGSLPAHPLVIKTAVTTELLRPITAAFGGTLIGDLLVGFKYHAHVLEQLERSGHFAGVTATLADFVIAVEESHGILVTPEIRDKDAAGAALLLAELAALQRQHGQTLLDYLEAIYRRYGYHANLGTSMVMTGAEGTSHIQAIQEGLRQHPLTQIGPWSVTAVIDHWDAQGLHGPIRSGTDRASRNVVGFRLDNGARVLVRPSGTEPKTKLYIEVPALPVGLQASRSALLDSQQAADAIAQTLGDDTMRQMLAVIGSHLPIYALRLSGLVPLDKRLDFVEHFLPGLEERARACQHGEMTSQAVGQWIDTYLASYGKDARDLVGGAVKAYLQQEHQQSATLAGEAARQRQQLLRTVEAVFFQPAG